MSDLVILITADQHCLRLPQRTGMTLWVRFRHGETEGFGILEGDVVLCHRGDLFTDPAPTGETIPLASVRLLAPTRPTNFVGLWNNYHEAAAKAGWAIPETPLFFLKSVGSIVGPDDMIRPPPGYLGRVLYEGELGLVIGRRCRNASEDQAAAAIFGLTCVNDVTALDLLHADPAFPPFGPQWARAKGCHTFGPVGPAIATDLDASALRVRTALNGRVRQDYPTADMILPAARIVSLLSREMTLEPGDLIACGTSIGALPMRAGMTVEVSIEGIGTLRNRFAPTDDVQPS